MVEFYDDCDFTHGCSVDHIIFDFDETLHEMEGGTEDARRRFEITLENADQFLQIVLHQSNRFIPMGVVQGWSPGSMAVAASRLVKMGYKYLAIGGMVPLKSPQIRSCLAAIRQVIPNQIQLWFRLPTSQSDKSHRQKNTVVVFLHFHERHQNQNHLLIVIK